MRLGLVLLIASIGAVGMWSVVVSLPVVQGKVVERGLDPDALEALWLALPEEKRNRPLEAASYRDLADAAVPEGDQRTQEMGVLLHTFFEFESILQYASVDFAAA